MIELLIEDTGQAMGLEDRLAIEDTVPLGLKRLKGAVGSNAVVGVPKGDTLWVQGVGGFVGAGAAETMDWVEEIGVDDALVGLLPIPESGR